MMRLEAKMGGKPRLTYEEVKQYFDNRGCKLLETEYKNHNTPLRYIATCGHEHQISFSNFQQGKGDLCRACRYRANAIRQSRGHEEIKAYFEAEGCRVLNDDFVSQNDKVRYIARCGHENVLDFDHFFYQKSGRVCNRCSKSIRYDIERVRQCFADEGCELLDTEYKNCKTRLTFRARCGHITHLDFDHFLNAKDYSKLCFTCAGEAIKQGKLKPGRRTIEMQEWRDAVYERDDFRCQICGARGGRLNAHHLYNYSARPDLAYDLSNGVTVCRSCHVAFHRAYRGDTTPEMFQEFKDNLVSGNTEVTTESKESVAP